MSLHLWCYMIILPAINNSPLFQVLAIFHVCTYPETVMRIYRPGLDFLQDSNIMELSDEFMEGDGEEA